MREGTEGIKKRNKMIRIKQRRNQVSGTPSIFYPSHKYIREKTVKFQLKYSFKYSKGGNGFKGKNLKVELIELNPESSFGSARCLMAWVE